MTRCLEYNYVPGRPFLTYCIHESSINVSIQQIRHGQDGVLMKCLRCAVIYVAFILLLFGFYCTLLSVHQVHEQREVPRFECIIKIFSLTGRTEKYVKENTLIVAKHLHQVLDEWSKPKPLGNRDTFFFLQRHSHESWIIHLFIYSTMWHHHHKYLIVSVGCHKGITTLSWWGSLRVSVTSTAMSAGVLHSW